MPVEVDYGSEYRYRNPIVAPNALAVVITQSWRDRGHARRRCARPSARAPAASRSATSSAAWRRVRPTGRSTRTPGRKSASRQRKAFTSQLVALQLAGALSGPGPRHADAGAKSGSHIEELLQLPQIIEQAIKASAPMEKVAERFYNRTDFLFLGRGINYPIALEGALKLKEISLHPRRGLSGGEMKHGPIALIDERMPVVAIAPERSASSRR